MYVTVAAGEPVTKENGGLSSTLRVRRLTSPRPWRPRVPITTPTIWMWWHRTAAGRPGPSSIDVTGDLDRWTVSQDNGDGTSYETVSGDNGLTEFSGTMTGQAADHFTADLPDADESSVVEAKAQEIAPAN